MREYSGEYQYQVVWQMGKSCLRLYSQLSYELLKFRESVISGSGMKQMTVKSNVKGSMMSSSCVIYQAIGYFESS